MADGFGYASRSARSSAQEAHIQARLAQVAAQRRRQKQSVSSSSESSISVLSSPIKGQQQPPQPNHHQQLITQLRTGTGYSCESSTSTTSDWASRFRDSISSASDTHRRDEFWKRRDSSHTTTDMDSLRAPMASSSNSLHSEYHHESLLRDPYEIHNGRRYLREVPYPLPCDLPEMQRQNLRTLLGCKIFGRAVCSPNFGREAPARILEVGCGTGYWSAMCHDYLSRSQGARNVAFTGLDIAPVAPDLNRSGMKWKFVQHDLRRVPLPFDDGEFDLVMIKDISMTLSFGQPYQQFISECVRILRYGGSIEVWESDHIIRSLLPHPPPAPNRNPQERDLAEKTATYCLTHSTPFAPAQNRYIRQANAWMAIALDRRKLTPTPCAGIMQMLSQEPTLSAIGCRRIAVPLNELSWERGMSRTNSLEPHDSPMSTESRMKGRLANQQLTEEQCALRQTALVTVIQMIESLELVLRDASGYGSEEWSHWWTAMMASLADPNSCSLNGESLELGAWWATKQYSEY